MKTSEIEFFFRELDRRVSFPVQVILTGGAAAAVFGVGRPTQDIDFEVHVKVVPRKRPQAWQELQKHLQEVGRITQITPEFSEDIDRWSSIALPERKSQPWIRIGKVDVRVLTPALWAVGKLGRYLSSDEGDLAAAFERIKSDPSKLAHLWGRALGLSPASSAQDLFRRHVKQFFEKYAVKLWGQGIDPGKLMDVFLDSARRARKK